MVNLGGYQLHLYCVGEGKPTVILSAGAGDLSTDTRRASDDDPDPLARHRSSGKVLWTDVR